MRKGDVTGDQFFAGEVARAIGRKISIGERLLPGIKHANVRPLVGHYGERILKLRVEFDGEGPPWRLAGKLTIPDPGTHPHRGEFRVEIIYYPEEIAEPIIGKGEFSRTKAGILRITNFVEGPPCFVS